MPGADSGSAAAQGGADLGLSLLGLVRHAAEVERSWFGMVVNGEDLKALWPRVDGELADFHVEDANTDEVFAFWSEACEE
ncbi:mycothiol transferase [Streptomyces sp. NPDC001770]